MIVQAPTPDILSTCDLLDKFIQEILHSTNSNSRSSGRFEAPIEARLLLFQAIRHTEAVISLARQDLVLLPAANSLTRAAFEICQRICWLLFPHDPYDREARWLAHLADEENLWNRLARTAQRTGDPVSAYSSAADEFFAFRSAVEACLPDGVKRVAKVPDLCSILREQGEERRYIAYLLLSQTVHGTHFATGTYRRNLGTMKEFCEPSFHSQWAVPFKICFWSLHYATHKIVEVDCESGTEPGTLATISALQAAISAI